MSSFSKAIASGLAKKHSKSFDANNALNDKRLMAEVQAHADAQAEQYSKLVATELLNNIKILQKRLRVGAKNLTPALKYSKKDYPNSVGKFWLYRGRTSKAFDEYVNILATRLQELTPSAEFKYASVSNDGRSLSLRFTLKSGMGLFKYADIDRLLMSEFTGVGKNRYDVPFDLRTLVFNEFGVYNRKRGGTHPARPIIEPMMSRLSVGTEARILKRFRPGR